MAAVFADYKFYVDWDNNGDFTDVYDDITAYVFSAQWQRGIRNGTDIIPQHTAGRCEFSLDNRDGRFSDYNAASPLYQKAIPGRPIKITMTIGLGVEKTMWMGKLDEMEPELTAEPQLMKVKLRGYGIFEWMEQRKKVKIALQSNKTAKQLLDTIAAAVGLTAGERRFDTGQTQFQKFWTDGEISALDAFRSVTNTEGGILLEGNDGTVVFEDRSHRFTAPHTVSQATYTNAVAGAVRYNSIEQILSGQKSVFNRIEASAKTFDLSEDQLLVSQIDIYADDGQIGKPIELAAGASTELDLLFPAPGTVAQEIAVNDWSLLDMQADTAIDGSGTDVSADITVSYSEYSNSMHVTLTNTGGVTAYIVVLRGWGVAINEGPPVEVFAEDATSIANFGTRVYPFPGEFIESKVEAEGWCAYLLSLRKDPTRAVEVNLDANVNAAHLLEAYTRDLSDRVTIVGDSKTSLYVNGDFFVEHMTHKVVKNGIHTVTYTCYAVAGTAWPAVSIPYTAPTVLNPVFNVAHVPDQLWYAGLLSYARVIFACKADKWNEGVDEAEFRAKLVPSGTSVEYVDLSTAAEGGTFTHNGTTQFILTGLAATWQGVHHQIFYGANMGRWYYSFKLHNAEGWSVWTDGNDAPTKVVQFVDTDDDKFSDSGPPESWTVKIQAGPETGTAVVVATRPAINGKRIWFTVFQIRDASAGSWRAIDDDAGAADVLYDGSAVAHVYDPAAGTITPASGNFGSAVGVGGLMLVDVRAGSFNQFYTKWVGLSGAQVASGVISSVIGLDLAFAPEIDGTYADVRIKIVKPPWDWNNAAPAANTDGFMGMAGYNNGPVEHWNNPTRGDLSSTTFTSNPFALPAGVDFADLEARVWFGTEYSFSDNGITSAKPVGTPTGWQIILDDAATIVTDGNFSDERITFVVNVTTDRILGAPSPSELSQPFHWCIINDTVNPVTITLDALFRWGDHVYAQDEIALDKGTVLTIDKVNSRIGVNQATPTAPMSILTLGDHVDNAAALAAGLVAGDMYRNGDVLMIVH